MGGRIEQLLSSSHVLMYTEIRTLIRIYAVLNINRQDTPPLKKQLNLLGLSVIS